ncbi:MAG: GHKL domain-containing protein [Ruminococcus sp.]|nr:GHKL domain-containing protein [Ruminococcus sp.]
MKKNFDLTFLGVLICAVLLNVMICFTGSGRGEYALTEKGAVKRSVIRAARDILSEFDVNEYGAALERLTGEAESLREYAEAKKRLIRGAESLPYLGKYTRAEAEEITERYVYSESEVQSRLELLDYCIERLEYSLSYKDYIAKIRENAEKMSKAGIFDGSIVRVAVRTAADFYGMENLRISAEPEEGIGLAVRGGVCDLLAAAAAVICGSLYGAMARKFAGGGRLRQAGYGAAFVIGICCIYGGNILAAEKLLGLGELSRAVQSISLFRSCCYPLSAGAFLAAGVICRAAAALGVYLLSAGTAAAEEKRNKAAGAAALSVILILSAVLSSWETGYPYKITGVYSHVKIFGESADPAFLMILGIAAGTILCGIFSSHSVKAAIDMARQQAQVDRYNRINERWTEARQIRHDIGNHMAAISALLDKGDVEGAKKYLGEAQRELLGTSLPARTGSAALDMLIAVKADEMKKGGVCLSAEFTAEFRDGAISDFDLCVIFGNLLDNAFEAVSKLNGGDRTVRLTVKRQMDMVMIYCENKYIGERPSAGGFATSKADKRSHGQGLKGIRRAAERSGGHMDIRDGDGIFSAAVIVKG